MRFESQAATGVSQQLAFHEDKTDDSASETLLFDNEGKSARPEVEGRVRNSVYLMPNHNPFRNTSIWFLRTRCRGSKEERARVLYVE